MRISDWSSDVCSADLIVALQHLPLVRSDWGARHPAGEADKKPCGAIGNSQKTGIAIGRLGDPVVDFGHGHDLWSAQFIYVAAVMCGIAGGDGDRLAHIGCIDRLKFRIGAHDQKDRKSTRLNSSNSCAYRMPSYA